MRIRLLVTTLAGLIPLIASAESENTAKSGAEVYERYCAACHAEGVLGAPRFGDRKAWRSLIKEGQRMLERTAIRGIRKMPPKGGHPHLTDLEVKRAVAYMANAAGGRFKTYE
ncbi:MAG: c-type cytochrome [Thiobacillaceae bacterium]